MGCRFLGARRALRCAMSTSIGSCSVFEDPWTGRSCRAVRAGPASRRLRLARREPPCGPALERGTRACGPRPCAQSGAWRHLDSCGFATYLHARTLGSSCAVPMACARSASPGQSAAGASRPCSKTRDRRAERNRRRRGNADPSGQLGRGVADHGARGARGARRQSRAGARA